MLKLVCNINKFYHIFGEAIGATPTRIEFCDLNNIDFLLGVQYDISEAMNCYDWEEVR